MSQYRMQEADEALVGKNSPDSLLSIMYSASRMVYSSV